MNGCVFGRVDRCGTVRGSLVALTAALLCLVSAPSLAVLESDEDEAHRLPEVEVVGTMIADGGRAYAFLHGRLGNNVRAPCSPRTHGRWYQSNDKCKDTSVCPER